MTGKHVQNYINTKLSNQPKIQNKNTEYQNAVNKIVDSLVERMNTLEETVKDIVEKITNVKIENKKRTK